VHHGPLVHIPLLRNCQEGEDKDEESRKKIQDTPGQRAGFNGGQSEIEGKQRQGKSEDRISQGFQAG
jgi:hypothetical protein